MPHTLAALAEFLAGHGMKCTIDGNPDFQVAGVATLEAAAPDQISFLSNPRYESLLATTRAGAVIVSPGQSAPPGMNLLRAPDPYAALTGIMIRIHGYREHDPIAAPPRTTPPPTEGGQGAVETRPGIHPNATIHDSAKIGKNPAIHHHVTICSDVVIGNNVILYPGVYLARGCRLGDDCVLFPNVVVYEGSILGNRVTIHANCTIGEDGLGYALFGGRWIKIPQIGIARIGDDVEIGANCTIDRATLGETVIGAGTKFSNLVNIGHGCRIGSHCMFVGHVGLAGSVTVGDYVKMGGKVGVAGHITIGDRAELAAMAGVMSDVPADARWGGAPAGNLKDKMRIFAYMDRLPEMARQLKELQARLEKLGE